MFDVNYVAFSANHIQHILDSLDRLLSVVHRINSDAPLWKDLSSHKGISGRRNWFVLIFLNIAVWSGITDVEQDALTLSLHIMFRMYAETPESLHCTHSAFVERRLFKFVFFHT
jgi:hypothetical protein